MSKGASREPQEIRILLAVLPETKSQGLFYLKAAHICRTSFFNIRLILSLMVSVLVVLKWTRTL